MNRTPVTTESPFNARSRAIAVAMVLGGLLISGTTLLVVGAQQQGRWPAAPAPFATRGVLLAHLLGVLPLALWCSRALVGRFGRREIAMAVCVGIGLAAVVLSWLAAGAIARFVAESSLAEITTVRLVWSWLLMLPWCGAAVLAWRQPLDGAAVQRADSSRRPGSVTKQRPGRPSWLLFGTDGVIALLFALLPAVYVQQVVERQTALLTHVTVNQQYLRAWQICDQLAALGIPQIAGQSTVGLRAEFRERVDAFTQQVQQPLPPQATTTQRLERASQLYSLGRFDEVEQLLGGMPNDPRALQRLALTDEAQANYSRAAKRYGQTIELISAHHPLSPEDLPLLRSALERRVNNLRRIGETRQAERELLAGLERWPQARDAVLMQLGFHYQMAGRTREAIDFFEQAAAANPRLEPQAAAAVAQLHTQAEGCLLRATRGATR